MLVKLPSRIASCVREEGKPEAFAFLGFNKKQTDLTVYFEVIVAVILLVSDILGDDLIGDVSSATQK